MISFSDYTLFVINRRARSRSETETYSVLLAGQRPGGPKERVGGAVLLLARFDPFELRIAERVGFALTRGEVREEVLPPRDKNSSARYRGGPNRQLKMIRHQAVAVQLERPAFFELGQGAEKRRVVVRLVKDILAIIAAVDDVVDQAVVDGAQ